MVSNIGGAKQLVSPSNRALTGALFDGSARSGSPDLGLSAYGLDSSGKAYDPYTNWLENAFTGSGDYQRSAYQAAIERRYNAQQAQLNRDFQERMSNTSYQRAVSDMRAAGLNPYLMFGSGSAASSPGGSTAHGPGGYYGRSGELGMRLLGTMVNTAMSALQLSNASNIAQLRSETALEAAATPREHFYYKR